MERKAFLGLVMGRVRAASVLLATVAMLVPVLSVGTGQSSAQVSPEAGTLPDWTFAVYLDGDNDLEQGALSSLDSMGYLSSNANLQIVVMLDRNPSYDTSHGDWSDTRVFNVHNGDTAVPEKNLANWDPHERNMGDPATLVEFGNYVLDNFPAKNYAFVLDDHGGGWRGVCYEYVHEGTSTAIVDYLTMPEMRNAFGQIVAHKGSMIDLVIFNACMMSHAAAYYDLRDYVNLVVGCEYKMMSAPYAAWNTKHPGHPTLTLGMLPPLAANTLMTSVQFGTSVVDQYIKYNEDFDLATNMGLFSVAGVSDSTYRAKLNALSMELIEGKSVYESQVENIRHLNLEVNPGSTYIWTIDLTQFADQIADPLNGIGDVEIRNAASGLSSYLKSPSVRLRMGYGTEANLQHGGLAIEYPCSICGDTIGPGSGWGALSISSDTFWDEFLYAYAGCFSTDLTPPSTTSSATGTAGDNGWWKSAVAVTLTGNDAGGVLYTKYGTDGGPYQVYSGQITLSEGQHTLDYYSVDGNGNVESANTRTYKIDSVAPVTTATVAGPQVTLAANDATSFVSTIYYRIDSGSAIAYSSPFTVGAGQHVVYYYSIDVAGNIETEKQASVSGESSPNPYMPLFYDFTVWDPASWNPVTTGGTVTTTTSTGCLNQPSMAINKARTSGEASAKHSFTRYTDSHVIVDAKLRTSTNSNGKNSLMQVYNGAKIEVYFGFIGGTTGGSMSYYSSGRWNPIDVTYAPNTWYEITFDINLAADVCTYDIYVDGILRKPSVPLYGSTPHGVDSVKFQAGEGSQKGVTLWVDEVIVRRGTVTFFETFNDPDISDWISSGIGTVTLDSTFYDSMKPSMKMVDQASDPGGVMRDHNFASQYGRFVVESKMRVSDKTNAADRFTVFGVGYGGQANLADICFSEIGYIRYIDGSSWKEIMTYNSLQWYDIAFVIDISGGTYDIYIDGQLMVRGALTTPSPYYGTVVDFASMATSGTHTMWVDDVLVYGV